MSDSRGKTATQQPITCSGPHTLVSLLPSTPLQCRCNAPSRSFGPAEPGVDSSPSWTWSVMVTNSSGTAPPSPQLDLRGRRPSRVPPSASPRPSTRPSPRPSPRPSTGAAPRRRASPRSVPSLRRQTSGALTVPPTPSLEPLVLVLPPGLLLALTPEPRLLPFLPEPRLPPYSPEPPLLAPTLEPLILAHPPEPRLLTFPPEPLLLSPSVPRATERRPTARPRRLPRSPAPCRTTPRGSRPR